MQISPCADASIAAIATSRLHQCGSCRSCCTVASYRLTLSGASHETRAEADPFFARPQVAEFVHSYQDAEPKHPLASPLRARLSGMPPSAFTSVATKCCSVIHFGMLSAPLPLGSMPGSMWTGMPHGFAGSVGKLKAAAQNAGRHRHASRCATAG